MFWRKSKGLLADEYEVDTVVNQWERACEGAGLVRTVDTVTGPTIIPPKIVHLVLGPPRVLTIHLQPGMLVEDIQAIAHRIAPHMGAYGLRVESRGMGEWAIVTLLDEDPLSETVPVTYAVDGSFLIGRLEDGSELRQNLRNEAHTIVQGVTRSGKSVFTYGLLAAHARQDDVLIAGIDPTGLLFRPFVGSRHETFQVSGLTDLNRHERLLGRLVSMMDERIEKLPADRDSIEITRDQPMVLLVLEELAGLFRAVDANPQQGKRFRALIGRLLAEGAKVGFRVLILVQRAEAAVVGAFERAMCSTRISFRCDNRASVELLHPGTDAVVADKHTTASAGVALVSTPGQSLARVRAPWFGDYATYVMAVQS